MWQLLLELLFYHASMAGPLGLELPLRCSKGLPLVTWRFPLSWFWSAEDRVVLDSISWQSGFPLFILGHFFFLGMGLGLDMEWAGVSRSFSPILTNTLRELVNNSFKESFYEKWKKLSLKEMLTNTLEELVNNSFKESFYGKRKKKVINALTVFFISHKSSGKTFLKWIVNQYPKGTR